MDEKEEESEALECCEDGYRDVYGRALKGSKADDYKVAKLEGKDKPFDDLLP